MIDVQFLCDLARRAGDLILEVYGTEFTVENKEDHSPLTLADRQSHELIAAELRARYPGIPVLSEEGREIPYPDRRNWDRFWLVDPLDGTKEFVKRNGEFTVNIALIEHHRPIIGVIHVPVQELTCIGQVGSACVEISAGGKREIHVSGAPQDRPVKVVKSRSHPSPDMESILETFPHHEVITRGSALKFCTIARGDADFYPRLGPTWEWDTAAGQAIVESAGGVVTDLGGAPFRYNKEIILNGPFMAVSSLQWLEQSGFLGQIAKIRANDRRI